jgi:hypothetical protein
MSPWTFSLLLLLSLGVAYCFTFSLRTKGDRAWYPWRLTAAGFALVNAYLVGKGWAHQDWYPIFTIPFTVCVVAILTISWVKHGRPAF